MADRRARETANLAPIWRRSLLECSMRPKTTRLDMAIVAIFLVAVAILLVLFVPSFLGAH